VSRSEKDVKFNWVLVLKSTTIDHEYRFNCIHEKVVDVIGEKLEDVMCWNLKQTVLGEKMTLVCQMNDNVDGQWSVMIGKEVAGSLERW
jgi:hypothetical protein